MGWRGGAARGRYTMDASWAVAASWQREPDSEAWGKRGALREIEGFWPPRCGL